MTRAAGLTAVSLALWTGLAGAGVRSDAISRSVLQPEERARLAGASSFSGDATKSLQARSTFDAMAMASIGRRSELAAEAVARLQAEYAPDEMRIVEQRSEMGADEAKRVEAVSDPAGDARMSPAADEDAWADRVDHASAPTLDGAQAVESVRALLEFVQQQSVSTKPADAAQDANARRKAILSQSAD